MGGWQSFAPSFGEGTLVRVHFIILRNAGKDPKPDLAELEQRDRRGGAQLG